MSSNGTKTHVVVSSAPPTTNRGWDQRPPPSWERSCCRASRRHCFRLSTAILVAITKTEGPARRPTIRPFPRRCFRFHWFRRSRPNLPDPQIHRAPRKSLPPRTRKDPVDRFFSSKRISTSPLCFPPSLHVFRGIALARSALPEAIVIEKDFLGSHPVDRVGILVQGDGRFPPSLLGVLVFAQERQ
jgi:hypothetical protein